MILEGSATDFGWIQGNLLVSPQTRGANRGGLVRRHARRRDERAAKIQTRSTYKNKTYGISFREADKSSVKQTFDADADELLAFQGDPRIYSQGAAGRDVTGNH